MINIKFIKKHLQLNKDRETLFKDQMMRKFKKLGMDLDFEVKTIKNKNRYVLAITTKYNNKVLNTKLETYNLQKGFSASLNKIFEQIRRTHEQKVNVNYL